MDDLATLTIEGLLLTQMVHVKKNGGSFVGGILRNSNKNWVSGFAMNIGFGHSRRTMGGLSRSGYGLGLVFVGYLLKSIVSALFKC